MWSLIVARTAGAGQARGRRGRTIFLRSLRRVSKLRPPPTKGTLAMDNKALTRRWFEEVWNKRNRDAIHELAHPEAQTYGLGEGRGPAGIEQFIPFWERFNQAFPDLKMVVDDVIAEGDKTAVRIHADATHTGEGLGIAATGRPVHMTGLIMIRWKDGQIIEAWNEFDAWGMMQQLAGPAPVRLKE